MLGHLKKKGVKKMIDLQHVTKKYSNGAVGLKDVSLHIEKGEFVFLTGDSGSGKSSLLKLLMKEIEPTGGTISINEKNLSKLKKRDIPYLRRDMGVVFQDFRLLSDKTVYENVAFAMKVVQAKKKEIRRTVPLVLNLVGLSQKANCYPNELSGGEQQRVAIARAITNNCPILIADEPTGNLDPKISWEIMQFLETVNRRGVTVIVATHEKHIVEKMDKRVIEIKEGIVYKDTKDVLKEKAYAI